MTDDLKVYSFTLGPLGANCFIVGRDGGCLIVDPGDEPEKVVRFLDRVHLAPHAVLVTHGHFDHFGGVAPLAQRYQVPVYIGAADAPQVERPELGPLAGFPVAPVTDGMVLLDGVEELDLPIPAQAIPTPGHSVGSYTFAIGGELFAGDLLFYGSIGRTDLGGGDYDQLLASVAELARRFPPESVVHCGHGPDTTLGRELKINPFLSPLRER
jgi:glyoxylase-like metal-dependent hydrolase (beta-lactamase superfamily II)